MTDNTKSRNAPLCSTHRSCSDPRSMFMLVNLIHPLRPSSLKLSNSPHCLGLSLIEGADLGVEKHPEGRGCLNRCLRGLFSMVGYRRIIRHLGVSFSSDQLYRSVAIAGFSFFLIECILLPGITELKGPLNEAYWNALKSRVYILLCRVGDFGGSVVFYTCSRRVAEV